MSVDMGRSQSSSKTPRLIMYTRLWWNIMSKLHITVYKMVSKYVVFQCLGWRSTGVVCQRYPYWNRIFSVFLLTTNLFQKIKVCVTLFVLLNVLLSTFGNTEVTIFMSCIYATQYRTNKLWFMHRHMWTTQKTARMKRLDCYSQKWQWQVNCYSELGPKIYDWMIMACLIVATAVCVPWQDKHVLTVAMQSVAQCVTYQIVITAQKLYVLYDTQLLACCTPYMNQNSILKHCKTLQETVFVLFL